MGAESASVHGLEDVPMEEIGRIATHANGAIGHRERIQRVLELEQRVRGLRLAQGHRDQPQGRQLHRESRQGLWQR